MKGCFSQCRFCHVLAFPCSHIPEMTQQNDMSHSRRKGTFRHVRPTKTQISVRIHAVRSVFVLLMKELCILGYPKYALWRFWSDCAFAQSDQNLHWAHMSKVGPMLSQYSVGKDDEWNVLILHIVSVGILRKCHIVLVHIVLKCQNKIAFDYFFLPELLSSYLT